MKPKTQGCIVLAICCSMPLVTFAKSKCTDENTTTLAINDCLSEELKSSEATLKKYLTAAYAHRQEEKNTLNTLKKSQLDWLKYKESYCTAIYTQWEGGSVQNTMALLCSIRLTQRRTYDIWQDYLTYVDSTPPILPKPITDDEPN